MASQAADMQGKDLTEFFQSRDQPDSADKPEAEDDSEDLEQTEYLNQNLPDLGVYVKEEPGSSNGGAQAAEGLQPVPA